MSQLDRARLLLDGFGPGERVVRQPYTRAMFERTQGWMREWGLLDLSDPDGARYDQTVPA